MCGIVGIIHKEQTQDSIIRRVESMMDTIVHRGPDGSGIWQDQNIVLGHRRLSIIDPEHGKQPLETPDGQLAIVFNGEIYNYIELKEELVKKGHPISSHSDTEVLLYAYREWGEDCLDHLLGMFAFAIWDKKNQSLFCARDRVGIKPFYYYTDGKSLVIASEIKAILASGLVKAELDPFGFQDYLSLQFCLGQKTMFRGIKKLEPGYKFTVKVNDQVIKAEPRQYWEVNYEVDYSKNEEWFTNNLSNLIEDAIRIHLRSDVPLGAHLSGGLDSTTIACFASKILNGNPISTFTGAFPEGEKFDETKYAKITAKSIGSIYNEIYIDGSKFPEFFPNLIYMMDEPLAGPGLIPQYFVSKLASEHVKVVLGGQGGDELFAGYTRYLVLFLENCLKKSIYHPNQSSGLQLGDIIGNFPYLSGYEGMIQNLFKSNVFGETDQKYYQLIDRNEGNAKIFSNDVFSKDYSTFNEFQDIFKKAGNDSILNSMLHFDLKGSLPALLHVEDRTSMAASIESRVPLLDHRIVEFLATVPEEIKFKNGNMKHLFKRVIEGKIPDAVYNRTDKMGFPTPLTSWLSGSSKEFVRDILLSEKARSRGLYNIQEVEKFVENQQEFGRVIWGLMCMEMWHRIYIDGDYGEIQKVA